MRGRSGASPHIEPSEGATQLHPLDTSWHRDRAGQAAGAVRSAVARP